MAFDNIRAALIIFDAEQASRLCKFQACNTIAEQNAILAAEWDAIKVLQEAFYEDTKHVNSREHCAAVDIDFMRKCVALEQ